MRVPTKEQTRCAPPESADLTERRNGKAKSEVLAAAVAVRAPVLAARAIPEAVYGPGTLEEADRRGSTFPAKTIDGFWGSAMLPGYFRKLMWRG